MRTFTEHIKYKIENENWKCVKGTTSRPKRNTGRRPPIGHVLTGQYLKNIFKQYHLPKGDRIL